MPEIFTRISNKHDLEINWLDNPDFVPLPGELVVYDRELSADGSILELPSNRTMPYNYARLKIGDGHTSISSLPFLLTYATKLDIENLFGGSAITTTSLLGTATLGQMILGG